MSVTEKEYEVKLVCGNCGHLIEETVEWYQKRGIKFFHKRNCLGGGFNTESMVRCFCGCEEPET
jgi:hypothetical protein